MACDQQAVALREGHTWRFQGAYRTAQKKLGLLLTHDFRAVDRRVLRALGIDPETRRRQDNQVRPGYGKAKVGVRDLRIINRALAMELLAATLLTCLDGPRGSEELVHGLGTGISEQFRPGPAPGHHRDLRGVPDRGGR